MPTLSERLRSAQPNRQNTGGCVTCQWWLTISPKTQQLINQWIDDRHSIRQLYYILSAPSDGTDPPLTISNTGFRLHMNHHTEKCREPQRPA